MSNPLAHHNLGGKKGKPVGTKDCTTPTRLRDVARLVAQHYKVGEIGKELGVTTPQARRLVLEAIDKGLVAVLEAGRDETTIQMAERRRGIANSAFSIIERRLKEASADEKEALSASAVNDAFRALDRTEHGAAPQKAGAQPAPPGAVTNVLNVFSPEVLRQAAQNGKRIWEGKVECGSET
jgi:hypothetical protein